MRSIARVRHAALLGVVLSWAVLASGRSPRVADQLSDADIQRLLHGVMEQLGIARPRVEYPAHQATNIVGPQSIQGGAHEGLQHLGPYGNIPNIVAELTGDNVPKDFSEDQGYPDPPNPCPLGRTVADGCLENSPDTAEFSRDFQQHQHLFDPEHDYPALAKWVSEQDTPAVLPAHLRPTHTSDARGEPAVALELVAPGRQYFGQPQNKEALYEKLKGVPKRSLRSTNPYLMGEKLDNVVAKKSVPHSPEEEENPTVSNIKT